MTNETTPGDGVGSTAELGAWLPMEQLPERPIGWTKRMKMHLNFGADGGAATFEIRDPDGIVAPFGYQYDTRKDGKTGFTLPGFDAPMTWSELRHRYSGWRAKKAPNAQAHAKNRREVNSNE